MSNRPNRQGRLVALHIRAYTRIVMTDRPSEPCTCSALRRATRAVTTIYDEALRPCGLRVTQFAILRLLDRLGPSPVTRLAAEAALERTTMGRNLDPLERRGLVRIEAGEADARARVVSLTDAGRAALAAAIPHWRVAQGRINARIEPAAVAALTEALTAAP
ncbi:MULTISPECIES: MarR family winged helix-turn-helix transcriptional regulator [unclassified Methylobacterium]|uniref:MarR family winged helix-turn-helix transcriptional regulator n=1 Tax=unclassified Methylobacterium TaxID=2615210 RepID=UPI001FEE59B0|nr:MarR family winged helix-turn-helix transcriptional regulator [Methylobacterium sp. WL64]